MLYRVDGTYLETGALISPQQACGLLEKAIVPSVEALATLEAEGVIVAGGAVPGARVVSFIMDVQSHDALAAILQGLPFWGLMKWDVMPLQGFRERHKLYQESLARMKSSAFPEITGK